MMSDFGDKLEKLLSRLGSRQAGGVDKVGNVKSRNWAEADVASLHILQCLLDLVTILDSLLSVTVLPILNSTVTVAMLINSVTYRIL